MTCNNCGNQAERIPRQDGWTCSRCKANFVHAPELNVVQVEVTSGEDGWGRSCFMASWHEDSGRVRAQAFHAHLGFHLAQWKAGKQRVVVTYANGVAARD